ncbi:MAG: hypothetical protein LBM98_05290 [Oscillospiraceae bacterium]|nr:hypothetical protein [Oscillospiraceae bacterium]
MDVVLRPVGCVLVTLVQTFVLIPSVEGCRRNGGVVSPPQRTRNIPKPYAEAARSGFPAAADAKGYKTNCPVPPAGDI